MENKFNSTPELFNIKPNKNEFKTSILVVDSRHRDKTKYPNPNQYIYNLNDNYKRVVSAELLYAYIPKSKSIVNNVNNELCISINHSSFYNIIFPIGNYNQDINIINNDNCINLDENINNILSNFSSDVSSICCIYNYNLQKYFFCSLYPGQIHSFTLDFEGETLETYEIKNVIKRIKGQDTFVKEKFLLETIKNYKPNSLGYVLGFKPQLYTNKEIKCYFETFPGFVKIICKSTDDFDLLYFTITAKNPLLSRILISNTEDFSTNTYLINFNPTKIIDKMGMNQPHLINIYNGVESNYTNTYKIQEADKNSLSIVLTNSLNWFKCLNNNHGYIRFCFIEANNQPIYQNDPYLLLQIDEFDRLDSINTEIQKSYELIPFIDTLNIFEHSHSYGNIKHFEPALSVLDKLNISFKDINGKLYDFMGQDHFMTFAVTYNNRYN